MDVENPVAPPPEAPPQESQQQDLQPQENPSLDSALADLFKTKSVEKPQANEKPSAPPQNSTEKKGTEQKEVVAKEDDKKNAAKPNESNKPLPPPESITPPEKLNSPKSKEGWEALRQNYAKAHSIIGEKDKEIERLKVSIAESENLTKKEKEDFKKEIESLSGYRQMVDFQADPEFLEKYEKPIESTITQIRQLLVDGGAQKEAVDKLTLDHLLDQGNIKLWTEALEKEGKVVSAKRLLNRLEGLMDSVEKKQDAISNSKTKYKEVLESRKKEAFTKQAEGEGQMTKYYEEVKGMKDKEGKAALQFLHQLTPAPGATPAEIEQIEKHNKVAGLLEGQVKTYMKASDPQDRVDIALAAAIMPLKNAELKMAHEQILALQEEIKKLSSATEEKERGSTPRGGNSSNGSQPQNADEALDSFFANR